MIEWRVFVGSAIFLRSFFVKFLCYLIVLGKAFCSRACLSRHVIHIQHEFNEPRGRNFQVVQESKSPEGDEQVIEAAHGSSSLQFQWHPWKNLLKTKFSSKIEGLVFMTTHEFLVWKNKEFSISRLQICPLYIATRCSVDPGSKYWKLQGQIFPTLSMDQPLRWKPLNLSPRRYVKNLGDWGGVHDVGRW